MCLSLIAVVFIQTAWAQSGVRPSQLQPSLPTALQKSTMATASPLNQVFMRAYGFDPLRADRMPSIAASEAKVRKMRGFTETVYAGRKAVAAPQDAHAKRIFAQNLDRLLARTTNANKLAVLYFVFKESIAEQQEDKRYWLNRLHELDKLSQAMGEQLQGLHAASRQLTRQQEDRGSPGPRAQVRIRRLQMRSPPQRQFKTTGPSLPQQYRLGPPVYRQLTRAQLAAEIEVLEAERETVRNDRQEANSQFENANQKMNQYINLLSSVMKTMSEMNQAVIRNLR